MPISTEAGTVLVRVERRFDVAEAHRVREALACFAPVEDLAFDFASATIDDAALLLLAGILHEHPRSRFVLRGLTKHHRRVLGYIGRPEVDWARAHD
jgi:hypothetical protein